MASQPGQPTPRPTHAQTLRQVHVAEASATKFFEGQAELLGNRIDAKFIAERERELLNSVKRLMPKYRSRPSLLLLPLNFAALAVGGLTALAPKSIANAVTGGMHEALVDCYNDELRSMQTKSTSLEGSDEVRKLLQQLRDVERAPEGAPPAPDLSSIQKLEDIGLEGAIAGVTKALFRVALQCTAKL